MANQTSDDRSKVVQLLKVSLSESAMNLKYRCPVCGEMVDPTSAEQILLHHEHATHPREFLLARAALA
jgi:competence CoiA-like predicted nuclease